MTKTETNLPQYFQVKMGKTEYEIETESLVSTLCHQFLNTNREAYNPSHYDILFNTTRNEIEDYLNHLCESQDNSVDLFGNWAEDFHNFQNEKNKIYCRDLIIDFSDGSNWSFRLLDILSLKYGDQEFGFDMDNDDPVLTSDEKLIEWVSELNWDDISHLAEEIKRPQPELDYSIEWKTANKEVKNWEKTINILDIFEITTEDYDEEDDD